LTGCNSQGLGSRRAGSRREYLPGLAGAMLSQGNKGAGLLQLLRYKSEAAEALRYPLRYPEV